MSNIFNDRTETELNERTINFQNLSVADTTIPILGLNNIVSGQVAGVAGLDLISKETLDDVKEDVLGLRLKNLSTAPITTESVPTINGDTINSTPVSTAGKNLMNITSISDLRSQILQTSEEAIVFTADTNNEINFYTGTTQTASDLRLQLKNELITLQTGDESMNMKLDNQNTWISFSEQLVFDNLNGDKINFYKLGTVLENNLYKLEVDTTTTKTLIYVSPEEHLFKVKDTDNPAGDVLQDILLLEKTHVHITSDSGIMLNGGFNIKNGNHGELATTTGNKNLYYKTHGTGQHIFYVDDTTEIFKIEPSLITIKQPTTITGSCTASNGFIGNISGDLTGNSAGLHTGNVVGNLTGNSAGIHTGNVVGNLSGNVVGATLNMTGKIETDDHMSSRYYRSIYFDSGIEDTFNEIEMIKFTGIPTPVDIMNFTFDKTESTSGSTKLSIDAINNKTIVYSKLELHDDLILNSDLDLATFSQPFLNSYFNQTYCRQLRIIGGVSYGSTADTLIDLRPVDYVTDASGLDTPPIYFNNGFRDAFTDLSTLRKSMILGTCYDMPTGEFSTASRNNIIFCCRESNDNQLVNVEEDEKLRIGQLAVYLNTHFIPKVNATYNIGSANFKFNDGYISNLHKIENYTTDTSHLFKKTTGDPINPTNDLLRLDNTKMVSYRKLEVHANSTGVVACANDGVNIAAMRYNTGLGCEFAGVVGFPTYISSQANLYLNAGSLNLVITKRQFIPETDGTLDLGSSSNRWKEIWASVGAINTSDRNKKKEIDYEDIDNYANELLNLKPCSYKMIDGMSNRAHTGLIAQDMEGTLFQKSGCYIKTQKTKTIKEYKSLPGSDIKTPVDKIVDVEGEYNYGLRYGELISPLIRLVQLQEQKINDLIARVDLLENGSGELSFI